MVEERRRPPSLSARTRSTSDSDELVAFLQLFAGDGESEIRVRLAFETLLQAVVHAPLWQS